jgi:hypothetical protein
MDSYKNARLTPKGRDGSATYDAALHRLLVHAVATAIIRPTRRPERISGSRLRTTAEQERPGSVWSLLFGNPRDGVFPCVTVHVGGKQILQRCPIGKGLSHRRPSIRQAELDF